MCMPANDKTIPSLIKWTGSKRKQAPLIAREAKSYNRYFEPFLGGGALLFLFAHEGAVASDIYEPLISLWKLIQSKPEEVISDYTEKWNALNVEYNELQLNHIKNADGLPKVFYDCRSRFNKTHNPLDLNFIMRTCVNGIVRFNGEGEFNNSFHLSRQGMKPEMFARMCGFGMKESKVLILNAKVTRKLWRRQKRGILYISTRLMPTVTIVI